MAGSQPKPCHKGAKSQKHSKVKEIYFIDYIDYTEKVIIIDVFKKEGYESLHLREGEFESSVINGLKFKAQWEFTIKE